MKENKSFAFKMLKLSEVYLFALNDFSFNP